MTDLGGSHTWLRDAAGGVERARVVATRQFARPTDRTISDASGRAILERHSIGGHVERVSLADGARESAILKTGGFRASDCEAILYQSGLLSPSIDGSPHLLASGDPNWLLIEDCAPARSPDFGTSSDIQSAFRQLANVHGHHRTIAGVTDPLTMAALVASPLALPSQAAIAETVESLAVLIHAASHSRQTWEIGATQVAALDPIREWVNGPFLASVESVGLTLLHGDYQVGNILIGANAAVRVIDWELAAIGPGILDLQFVDVDGRRSVLGPSGNDALVALDAYSQRLSDLGAPVPIDPIAAARDAVIWGALAGARDRLAEFASIAGPARGNRAEIPGQIVDLLEISGRGARRRLGL